MTKAAKPIVLDHRVDLYIPSQCVCGESLPEKLRGRVIEDVKEKFANWFGGHAEIQIKGDWRLPDGTIAKEEVADIYSFCTSEALEQHHEDVDQLAVDIANRLTQDRVLRVFDNLKVALWPNTLENLKAKKNCACRGGATAGIGLIAKSLEIGKGDRLSKMLVIQGILRSFTTIEHARKLFCDVLNYQYASGELPCAKWPDSIQSLLDGAPSLLADHNGFKVVYLRLSADELRRSAERIAIQRICKDDPTFRGLIVVSDQDQENWELVNVKVRGDDSNRLILRRLRVGVEAVRTATERLATLEVAESEESSVTADELEGRLDKAFDVEAVTKAFFTEVANWYFWALKHARFPKDAPKEKDGRDHVSVIRLITRLIFCWFVKEKSLVPAGLFDERKLADLLVDFAPGKVSNKDSVFYKAILQNLFFATLNMEMNKRDWRRDGQNFMAHSLYRHKRLFAKPDEALALFKNIPFLNGGLFECLDKMLGDKTNPRYERIDGFSDREDSQPTMPDFLFFGEELELDLSKDYGDNRFKKVKVRGLIHTLNHYRFTIEESTPLEEEVALDPELAGKIFENLLAAYNPETGATARKQTGSFYTPREIVNYMVDEALIAYLKGKFEESFPKAADVEPRLWHLFSYEEEGHRFTANEVEALIAAIDQLKALDPAVGSGAFPMGILHKLVFILGRLDPRNEMWKERQKQRLRDAMATAERIQDVNIRENTLQELEQQLDGIDEAFEKNALDYGRKLYLIENCLYGVDIQPIAVQIAKMRFFISLIADQKVDPAAENLGVRPLPNLETKLVAANTLIGIEKPKQLVLRNQRIDALEAELRRVRERHFLARTPTAKAKCRERDQKLRVEIAELLKKDGWADKTAKQLAGWDPYDQNASSQFFDPEWMFGVQDGFEVCLGNPPYVLLQGGNQDDALNEYFRQHFKVAAYKLDLYHLFIERGVNLLKQKGVITYITPSNFASNNYTVALRRFLLTETILDKLVFFDDGVFDASVHNLVFFSCKSEPISTHTAFCKAAMSGLQLNVEENSKVKQADLVDDWCLLVPRVASTATPILLKMSQAGETFGSVASVNFGMQLRDRTEYQQDVVESPSSKPLLTKYHRECYAGKDIHRFYVTFTDRYCFFNRTAKRGGCWDEAIHNAKGKILVRQIGDYPEGGLDTRGYAVLNAAFMILPRTRSYDSRFLLGVLNSAAIRFYWLNKFRDDRRTFPKIKGEYLKLLPLPRVDSGKQTSIAGLVQKVVETKRKDPTVDTMALERDIDLQVYTLFGLTKDEIKIVEKGR